MHIYMYLHCKPFTTYVLSRSANLFKHSETNILNIIEKKNSFFFAFRVKLFSLSRIERKCILTYIIKARQPNLTNYQGPQLLSALFHGKNSKYVILNAKNIFLQTGLYTNIHFHVLSRPSSYILRIIKVRRPL